MINQNPKNERWKLLISNLRDEAISKFGKGWQTKLAEITPFTQSSISRMFALNSSPSLKNYGIIVESIEFKKT